MSPSAAEPPEADSSGAPGGRPTLLPYGEDAVLVQLADLDAVRAWTVAASALEGVIEVVPAARTVLVVAGPGGASGLRTQLERLRPDPVEATAGPLVEIPVTYDGPDLRAVADLTRVSTEEVIRRHQDSHFICSFSGFAPGFGYLTGLDPILHVPRRATPRTRVPAGSVAIAEAFSAVYPTASPGGWQLLGRTDVVLFDPSRTPPALLAPGTRVRFVPT